MPVFFVVYDTGLFSQVIDGLKPEMSLDLVLDMGPAAGVTTAEVNTRPICESMGARLIEAQKLLTQHKQQARNWARGDFG